MIEEVHAEAEINGRLIWVVNRTSHLIQTESHEQLCLVRNLMINPN